jgi:hypothetical protein
MSNRVPRALLGLLRKLGDRLLAVGAQLCLIALEALLQFLASLTGTHVLSIVFAGPRDSLIFTRITLSLRLSESAHDENSDQCKMCQFHQSPPSTH